METLIDFIFLGSKVTADGECSDEIKRRLLLGRKAITNLDMSFREFLDFHGYTVTQRRSPTGQMRKRILDAEGESYD